MSATEELDEVLIRPVEASDGPRIVALEQKAPVVAGDLRFTIDRGTDYFAATRLMESVDIVVAEVRDELVAVHCAAFPVVRIGGVDQRVNYIHHLRIAPEYQRRRLLGRIKQIAVPRYAPDSTTSYAYVDVTNPLAQSMRANRPNSPWSVTLVSCELDTKTHTGRPAGIQATSSDVDELVDALNRSHQGEEFWRELTPDLLAARLSRDAGHYSWSDLYHLDGAVIGLWRIGRTTQIITDGPDGRSVARQAVVLDHALSPGGEDAFSSLIGNACARAEADGLDRLVFFTYQGSPLHQLVGPMAVRTRTFDLWTTAVQEPQGTTKVHLDPVYF